MPSCPPWFGYTRSCVNLPDAATVARGFRRPIVQEAALLWSANIVAMAAGFLVPLTLARLAMPADYGRFSFVTAMLATLSIVTLPGLNLAITQGAARGQDGTLGVALKSRRRGGWLMVVVVLAVGAATAAFGDRPTGWALLLVAPFVMGAYGLDSGLAFLNGLHAFKPMALFLTAAAVVPALVVVPLVFAGAPIPVVIAGYVLALCLVNLAALRQAHRLRRNAHVDAETVRYGRRMTWISSLGLLQFYIDRVIVGAALGFVDLALYSAAKLFQQGLKTAWSAINQVLFPRLAAATDPVSARTITWTTLGPIWLGFALLAAIAAALAPVIVSVVFGPTYLPSITPARVLMLAVVIGIPGAQFEMLFRATSDERRLYTQRVTFTVAEILATGVGALWYGTLGASVGMAIAYGLNTVVGFVLNRSQ